MFKIDKVVRIPDTGFRRSVDLLILELVEPTVPFRVSYIDYSELKPSLGARRFHIKAAYGERDK